MGIQLGRVNHLARKKQHLTPDSGPEDVVQIACDLCGLHATRATTPYPSLLARCRDFLNQQANVRQVQEMLPLPQCNAWGRVSPQKYAGDWQSPGVGRYAPDGSLRSPPGGA